MYYDGFVVKRPNDVYYLSGKFDAMNLKLICMATSILVLLVSCSQYEIRELDYEDRLVDEGDLLEMPSFERTQEVCKRTVLALQRAEILSGISAQLKGIASAKDNIVAHGQTCYVEYHADCINCGSRKVKDCYYAESVSVAWSQLEHRREDLMRQADRLRKDSQQHYAQCAAYLKEATPEHAVEIHLSGLEPPLFAPTPILPVDMSETYDALILATGVVLAASADAYIQAKYN